MTRNKRMIFNISIQLSNQARAIAEFSSSLFKVVLRSRSQTKGVLSSAKLQTLIFLRAKNNINHLSKYYIEETLRQIHAELLEY